MRVIVAGFAARGAKVEGHQLLNFLSISHTFCMKNYIFASFLLKYANFYTLKLSFKSVLKMHLFFIAKETLERSKKFDEMFESGRVLFYDRKVSRKYHETSSDFWARQKQILVLHCE